MNFVLLFMLLFSCLFALIVFRIPGNQMCKTVYTKCTLGQLYMDNVRAYLMVNINQRNSKDLDLNMNQINSKDLDLNMNKRNSTDLDLNMNQRNSTD